MQIEKLSIKTVTVAIFAMIGIVAIILSTFAGFYFKKAAMDAQVSSLSRVIEVASQEMIRNISSQNFELGMKLGNNKRLINELQKINNEPSEWLLDLLDDPFISGFPGFANINLAKLRIYSLDLELQAESRVGIKGLENHLPQYLATQVIQKSKRERLKAVDALWLSNTGPLFSTLVPVGGLRAVGYIEIVTDPEFNLSEIGNITKTPVNVFAINSEQNFRTGQSVISENRLPVTYQLKASDGSPAFKIVGYEDVSRLSNAMSKTQLIATGGFLFLTLSTLLFALWLFNRFMFEPLSHVMTGMRDIANGKLNFRVKKTGLLEFVAFADSFELMSNQIKNHTNELERLLDLDSSAILFFEHGGTAVYFNKAASELLGYSNDEIGDLELDDIFPDDIVSLMKESKKQAERLDDSMLHLQLKSLRKDGQICHCDAMINPLDVKSGLGYTIVLTPVADEHAAELSDYVVNSIEKNDQRMLAVEESIKSILEIAKNNPGMLSEFDVIEKSIDEEPRTDGEKRAIRELTVSVMSSSLTCWEHDIGKNKITLAEQSGIWPVYIDKSTPTTRTLDKYLHIDSCPKNPRFQRVIDTAEFVLKSLKSRKTDHRKKLEELLEEFRTLKIRT